MSLLEANIKNQSLKKEVERLKDKVLKRTISVMSN